MQIAIALYPEFTALDAIGPYQVFSNLPGADVVLCAATAGRVSDDNDLVHLDVVHAFDEVPAPDVLVVPGSFVARRMARDGDPVVDWIRDTHARSIFTTSVCTGSLLLGAAGVLQGKRATSHWTAMDELRSFGAVPTTARVVDEGSVLTAAGVSAGIDLALTLVGRIAGPEVAQAIQLGIEYDPRPPYDAGSPATAPAGIVELVREVMASR